MRVIHGSLLDGIARIHQIDEIDPLHHATAGDIKARNNAHGEGHVLPRIWMIRIRNLESRNGEVILILDS